MLVIPAGYLEGDPKIIPQANIFCEEKPAWFDAGQNAASFDQYPE